MNLLSQLRRLLSFPRSPRQQTDIKGLQNLLGYRFRDKNLLRLSLTHRSLVRARDRKLPSNERLEFLGDSVLGLVIAAQLYCDYPALSEGDLTKLKAMLVNETSLSQAATSVGLHRHVFLSADEERSGGRERPSITADAFEAVIGAIYLDGGIQAARRMILESLYVRRHDIAADSSQQNYKGELLEAVQGNSDDSPRYEVVSESGPDHDKVFHVVVSVGDRPLGEGRGNSKKDAEQKAARLALEQLRRQHRL